MTYNHNFIIYFEIYQFHIFFFFFFLWKQELQQSTALSRNSGTNKWATLLADLGIKLIELHRA